VRALPRVRRTRFGQRLYPQDQPQRVAVCKIIGLRDALRLVSDTTAVRRARESFFDAVGHVRVPYPNGIKSFSPALSRAGGTTLGQRHKEFINPNGVASPPLHGFNPFRIDLF
jgi:hypothetical protein